jgi:hypothetical protein
MAPRNPDVGQHVSPALAPWRRAWESENAKQPIGDMPQPATVLSGFTTVSAHVRDGDKGAGLVDDSAHHEHDESDEAGKGPALPPNVRGAARGSLMPSVAPSNMPPNNGPPRDRTAASGDRPNVLIPLKGNRGRHKLN